MGVTMLQFPSVLLNDLLKKKKGLKFVKKCILSNDMQKSKIITHLGKV